MSRKVDEWWVEYTCPECGRTWDERSVQEFLENPNTNNLILKMSGKPNISEFDKSFYSDGHDVPALYIGDQIVEIGDGYSDYNEKHDDHLRFKLDFDACYEVIIRKVLGKHTPGPPEIHPVVAKFKPDIPEDEFNKLRKEITKARENGRVLICNLKCEPCVGCPSCELWSED
jgi:hypothetical protein